MLPFGSGAQQKQVGRSQNRFLLIWEAPTGDDIFNPAPWLAWPSGHLAVWRPFGRGQRAFAAPSIVTHVAGQQQQDGLRNDGAL